VKVKEEENNNFRIASDHNSRRLSSENWCQRKYVNI